jgi:hypothetical protein
MDRERRAWSGRLLISKGKIIRHFQIIDAIEGWMLAYCSAAAIIAA